MDFTPYTGDYDKRFYDVKLADGTIIPRCWPNAGKLVAMDGSGRMWDENDSIWIRPAVDSLDLDQWTPSA